MDNCSAQGNSGVPDRSLRDLDDLVALARKRLARLKSERGREIERGLTRLLSSNAYLDSVGDRLIRRLDEVIAIAEERLEQLEEKRAILLLASIDGLLGGGGE